MVPAFSTFGQQLIVHGLPVYAAELGSQCLSRTVFQTSSKELTLTGDRRG